MFDFLVGTGYQGGPVIAQFLQKDQNKIEEYLSMPEIRRLLPSEKRYTRFLFGKPDINTNVVELYAIQSNRDNKPPLGGSVVVDASQSYDQVGAPAVSMQMNGKGARKWEEMTGKAFNDKSNIAIVLDEKGDYRDYHLYRQDNDGLWSHKQGKGKVKRYDASNNHIKDPKTADRNYSTDDKNNDKLIIREFSLYLQTNSPYLFL